MGSFVGPDIIDDGLVLALDAASERSYPGTGTTWTDITGESENGVLSNSPTFSNDNYGVLDFDGTDDYATIASSAAFTVDTRTVQLVFRMNASYVDYTPLAIYSNGGSTTDRIFLGLQSSKWRMHGWGTDDPAGTTNIAVDTWYICTFSYSLATQAMKMYTNGVLEASITNSQGGVTATTGMNWSLATIPGGWAGPTYSDVSIACFDVYNRILSDAEVAQNFNAIRSRFGL